MSFLDKKYVPKQNAVNNHLFRVFVSSTFKDMELERNYLQKNTFKALTKLCNSYGYQFQAIDLRWGIPEGASIDQKGALLCLKELDRCQRMSLPPNFIALLGERYGWTPPPAEIPEDERDYSEDYPFNAYGFECHVPCRMRIKEDE